MGGGSLPIDRNDLKTYLSHQITTKEKRLRKLPIAAKGAGPRGLDLSLEKIQISPVSSAELFSTFKTYDVVFSD